MLRKTVGVITALSLAMSCNIVNQTTNEKDIMGSFKKFGIKSTTSPNEVKKNFLPITRISKQKGKEREKDDDKKRVFTFSASEDDLKRNFILNITNGAGGGEKVGNLEVFINGTQVIFNHDEDIDNIDDINKIKKKLCKDDNDDKDGKDSGKKDDDKKFKVNHDEHNKNKPSCELLISNFFNRKTDNLSVNLPDIKEGLNTLEVKVKDERNNYAIDISIDGFLKAIDIPNSVHSMIPDNPEIRNLEYRKGKINIKFLEGMRVRLITNADGSKKLIDLNGTSLSSVEKILNSSNLSDIERGINLPYEDLDAEETEAETFFEYDVANQGLFYSFIMKDTNADVWAIIDKLKKLPFVEEAYPEFIGNSSDSTLELTDELANQLINERDKKNSNIFSIQSNKDKKSFSIKSSNDPSKPDDTWINYKIGTYDGGAWLKNTHIMKNTQDNGIWSKSTGDANITLAVIDTGGLTTHEDLKSFNYDYIDNTDSGIIQNSINKANIGYTLKASELIEHGVNSSSVLGAAQTNNGKGTAGVGGISKIINIKGYHQLIEPKIDPITKSEVYNEVLHQESCTCKGTGAGIGKCNAVSDSIIIARKNNAKVIVLEKEFSPRDKNGAIIQGAGLTLEQGDPSVRSLIASSIAKGHIIVVPAGNASNTDISKIEINKIQRNMPDTGSIIVGGLNINGDSRFNIKGHTTGFNYGKSQMGGTNNLYTINGHGVDVSGPAERVFTLSSKQDSSGLGPSGTNLGYYDPNFGGTSAASPLIGGIIGVILAQRANIKPLEIRRALRKNQQYIDPSQKTAGMVNAFDTLNDVINTFPKNITYNQSLIGKFYRSSVYLRPEVLIDGNQNIPHAVKYVPDSFSNGINYTGLNPNTPAIQSEPFGTYQDPFRVGLKDFFVTDFDGYIDITSSGNYTFFIGHDDGAILEIDDNVIIDANFPTNYQYATSNNTFLSVGKHKIRLMFSEIKSEAALSLWWLTPSGQVEIIPTNKFFHDKDNEKDLNVFNKNLNTTGLLGRFFNNVNLTDFSGILDANGKFINPPVNPAFQDNRVLGTIVPLRSKSFFGYPINFTGYNEPDLFSVGQIHNDLNDPYSYYSASFIGFISTQGLPSGNYKFEINHDGGAYLAIDSKDIINDTSDGSLRFSPNVNKPQPNGIVSLNSNTLYPVFLSYSHYKRINENIGLQLYWTTPNGVREIIPSQRLSY
ncbi:MAG: PA14 domain-containing protein [Candidatus Sericytochromatia bacterium]